MSPDAIAVMILVPGIVWGGFIFCLAMAIRKEKKRGQDLF
jgi:hypothetical protein